MRIKRKPKFYITLPDLFEWAYNITEQTSVGQPYHDAYGRLVDAFDNAEILFRGLLTYTDPQDLHSETPQTLTYPAILSSGELYNYYLEAYEDRLISTPVEIGRWVPENLAPLDYNSAMYRVLNNWCRLIEFFVKTNKEKYLRMLQLLNLKYNPIDNYDGQEHENFGYEGKETLDREIHADTLSGLKITGPTTNAAISQEGTISADFANAYKKTSAVAQVSDTVNGSKAGNATVSEASGITTASTTTAGGIQPKSSHYTTTYDDSSNSRLESYDTNDGTVAQSQKGTQSEDVPTMVEAYSGSPSNPSYTDTKEFELRKDKRDLTKWGNMGTTMTQDMINKEREMLMEGWNVVKIFCEDLSNDVFLSCYYY